MSVSWIKVFIAGMFEILWVIGLKHAHDFWTWTGTVIAIAICFYLLVMAGEDLPVGTVYAVFVGIGTTGTVLSEIIFFNEPFKVIKIFLIFVLLIGIMGLKLVTEDKEHEGANS
ncbi:paired small multidrug resistance pump [Salirhabdus euzebyi]|uniref:Paired small multidrug resistance pump n=1 Tax=Salirhabdus euzebyi TaxID=394506 RepID=A0A841PWX3_9BACI|nr:multidrug efflux SMR transporter [Salirhabdus euzebyi]MBB6451866.1 paired small multidrug resistance pump [Salirhabdus euzebyi]